jgi:hypothetical protein
MKKARDRDERARLEEEIRKPIRPQVIRPHGFAVPDDPEAIKRENELMEELHQKAIAEVRRDKLKLLCRRYSLAEDDYRGLALNLAIEHEPRRKRKLRLLCRRYSLAENDYEGLALKIAIQHEPGFRVVDRQITRLRVDRQITNRPDSPQSQSCLPRRADLGRVNVADASQVQQQQDQDDDAEDDDQPGFFGLVRIEEGVLIDKRTGRPIDWPPERYLQLIEAVQTERKTSGVTKDLDALKRLARRKEWARPPNHRGELDAWVRTLQSRLHDAKQLQRKLEALNAMIEEAERQTGK